MTPFPGAADRRDGPCFSTATALAAGYLDGSLWPYAIDEAHLRQSQRGVGPSAPRVRPCECGPGATRRCGQRWHAALGPLDGVPVAVKGFVAITGAACEAGSPSLRERASGEDAAVIRQLRAWGCSAAREASHRRDRARRLGHQRLSRDPTQSPHGLVQRFVALIREAETKGNGSSAHGIRRLAAFEAWVVEAKASDIRAAQTIASGPVVDAAAVRAALTMRWSNAHSKGQITN